MDTSSTKTALCLTLLVLILAIITSPVSADSCTTHGLQVGQGAAESDKETFGCRNTVCDSGSPGYHIILHGDDMRSQKVEVNLQKACDGSSVRFQDTILVLMSGSEVNWVLTGFTPGIVFLVGDGTISQDAGETEFKQYNIDVGDNYHQYLRRYKKTPSGDMVQALINALQENNFDFWLFNHPLLASVNYAWKPTSWTLTAGEDCCHMSSTVPWWKRSATTTRADIPPPPFPTSPTAVTRSSAGLGITGISTGIGAIVLIVVLSIIITIVCLCCCQNGKRTTTSQTNQLNTVQGLHNIETGSPMTAGVSHLGAAPHSAPNGYVQSHPAPFNYPTAGPQPSAGAAGHPEQPPSYNDVHPIKPPSYSQVVRENNCRAEPSAPTLHM